MPTLNYEMETICANCTRPQTTKIPRGKHFHPFLRSPDNTISSSHYHTNAGHPDDKEIDKKCDSCAVPALVIDPRTLPEGLYESFNNQLSTSIKVEKIMESIRDYEQ